MSSTLVKERIAMGDIQNTKGYMLVDFWAEWCAPCKRLAPIFELAAQQNKGVQFAKINVDENPDIASSYNIRSIPTMILFKDGQAIQTKVGGMDLITLNEWVAQYTK